MDNECHAIADHMETIADLLYESSQPEDHTSDFQQEMSNILEILDNSANSHLQFQSYFLLYYYKDVWNNIGMVSSQRLHNRFIIDILTNMGFHFGELSKHTRNRDFEKCYERYVSMLNDYESMIEERNRIRGGS